MNPLIKRTTERVLGHEMRQEDISTAVIIGNAIFEAVDAALSNPDFNLKGGNDIDKNTIGNFDVPKANKVVQSSNAILSLRERLIRKYDAIFAEFYKYQVGGDNSALTTEELKIYQSLDIILNDLKTPKPINYEEIFYNAQSNTSNYNQNWF